MERFTSAFNQNITYLKGRSSASDKTMPLARRGLSITWRVIEGAKEDSDGPLLLILIIVSFVCSVIKCPIADWWK